MRLIGPGMSVYYNCSGRISRPHCRLCVYLLRPTFQLTVRLIPGPEDHGTVGLIVNV